MRRSDLPDPQSFGWGIRVARRLSEHTALVETAVGIVVASFLGFLTVAMTYLAMLSLGNEVHSPQLPPDETAGLAAGGLP